MARPAADLSSSQVGGSIGKQTTSVDWQRSRLQAGIKPDVAVEWVTAEQRHAHNESQPANE
jgi:hypothetical protein